ncbi:FMN-linked oxidoreductase [Russula earlei]|uniref:FMN-linked oxidoreductase n=1 Tax=Russula earlei TaxID=71964 RepID=A0ACC0U9Z1_9AGAM|nr:FMN-linked oxidoreductase [Russula earlei]
MSNSHDFPSTITLQPAVLPSGLVMSNGLVKAAMYEHMASLFGGSPNSNHIALYKLWSQGGWGMIITGNVQVSRDHLTLGRDMIIPSTISSDTVRAYRALACAMRPASEQHLARDKDLSTPRTLVIMQVSHAGRQSPVVLGGRAPFVPPLAPSALGLGRGAPSGWFGRLAFKIGFPTPRTMNVQDIDYVVSRFVLSAKLAHDAGFDGIELHASHGYLLAQFISAKSNIRDDAYSAKRAPLHLLRRIVTSIREVLPRPFVLGVKLNSSDYVGVGSAHDPRAEEEAEDRAVAQVVDIAHWDMIDFIEISGGDYEDPAFLATSRQAFYSRFARKARFAIHALTSSSPLPLVLLTGGMRSSATIQNALTQGHADLVGVGRGSVLAPNLPLLLKEYYQRSRQRKDNHDGDDEDFIDRGFPFQQPRLSYMKTSLIGVATSILRSLGILPLPSLIGAGATTAWYIVAMRSISRDQKIDHRTGTIRAVLLMWLPELRASAMLLSCCVACVLCICLSVVSFLRTIESYEVPTHSAPGLMTRTSHTT